MKANSVLAVSLSVSAALVVIALVTARAEAAGETKTIATTATADFRVVVKAINRGGGGGAPPATVIVRTFERSGGSWSRTGERSLAGAYFWKTITGPLAVCRLEIRTAGGKPRALVQLLRSPSLGCGPVTEHRLTG
jgi:hypothetical protein